MRELSNGERVGVGILTLAAAAGSALLAKHGLEHDHSQSGGNWEDVGGAAAAAFLTVKALEFFIDAARDRFRGNRQQIET